MEEKIIHLIFINYKKYSSQIHKDYNFVEPLKYFVPSIGI